MRALSIRQPFAEQILTGKKKIEFRTIKTNIMGKFYIYSSKKVAKGLEKEAEGLPTGVIVGTVELVNCVRELTNVNLDYNTCDISYEWHLKNPKRLKRPLKPTKKPQPVWFNPF